MICYRDNVKLYNANIQLAATHMIANKFVNRSGKIVKKCGQYGDLAFLVKMENNVENIQTAGPPAKIVIFLQ